MKPQTCSNDILPGKDSIDSPMNFQTLENLNLPPVWLHVMDQYQIMQEIGQGSFGSVIKANCKSTGQDVAIKLIKDFQKYDYDCCKVIREIQIMTNLREVSKDKQCRFIPQLIDIIIPDVGADFTQMEAIFLVMEYEEVDLRVFMQKGQSLAFSKDHLRTVIYNILCAMSFCHSSNVIHRDIKPSNFLINSKC